MLELIYVEIHCKPFFQDRHEIYYILVSYYVDILSLESNEPRLVLGALDSKYSIDLKESRALRTRPSTTMTKKSIYEIVHLD